MLSLKYIKEKVTPICQKYNVKKAYLFGSYARNEATQDSDVDLHIVFGDKIGLLTLNRINDELELALNKNVDIVTRFPQQHGISYYDDFKRNVLNEEVILYG